jgi:hypothetical protein
LIDGPIEKTREKAREEKRREEKRRKKERRKKRSELARQIIETASRPAVEKALRENYTSSVWQQLQKNISTTI